MRKNSRKEATGAAVAEKRPSRNRVVGVALAKLVSAPEGGRVRIVPAGAAASEAIEARLAASLTPADEGAEVVVVFEGGRGDRPIVIGRLGGFPGAENVALPTAEAGLPLTARLDGETVVLEAKKEIVLRCGEATITLTRAGKVLIQGTYVSSRSTGLSRIRGGAVQIN